MSLDLPAYITEPLSWTGMEWPKGDEDALAELSDGWKQYHDKLQQISSDLESVRHGFDEIGSGLTFDAIYQTLGSIVSEDFSTLIDGADHLSDCCDTMAVEIYVLKMIFIVELAILLAYVTFLIATSEINWSAPLEIAEAILQGQITLREAVSQVVRRILAKILEKSIEEIAETGVKDLTKQAAQKVADDIASKYATEELRAAAKEEILIDMAVETAKKTVFTTRDQIRDRVLWDKPIDVGDISEKAVAAGLTGGLMSQPSKFVAEATGVERTQAWLVSDMHPSEAPGIGRSAVQGAAWISSDFVSNRETGIVSKQVEQRVVTPFVSGKWRPDSSPSDGNQAATSPESGATQPTGATASNDAGPGGANLETTSTTSAPASSKAAAPTQAPTAP